MLATLSRIVTLLITFIVVVMITTVFTLFDENSNHKEINSLISEIYTSEKLAVTKFGKLTLVLIRDNKKRFFESKSIENTVQVTKELN